MEQSLNKTKLDLKDKLINFYKSNKVKIFFLYPQLLYL